MDAETVELEDGEIVDNEPLDIFGSYNILQRPQNITKTEEAPVIVYSDESDDMEEKASDSDESDSDSTKVKLKRQKVTAKRLRKKSCQKSSEANNDKYKVWLAQAQEEILTQNLVSCGVTKNLYSDRNVESYDFTLSHNMNRSSGGKSSDEDKGKEGRRFTNKRSYADRFNVKLRLETVLLGRLGLGKNSEEEEKESKIISELSTTKDSTDIDVAEDISNKLGEKKSDLIKRVVDIIGKEKAIEFYEKTKKIEKDGGMLVLNGSRRRTPGGVYLFLVKNDRHIPRADIREIFIQDKKDNVEQKRKANSTRTRDKAQDLRRRLENNSDKDLPALLTRAELSTRQIAEEARLRRGEGMDRLPLDSDRTVSNPPPSPVTDDPDHTEQPAHGRQIQSYNDDILDLDTDGSMDLF